MTRLIDADALNYVRVRIAHEDGTIGGYNAVVPSSEIKNAPTVDAVPVIRCKDCKYYTGKWCKRESIHAADLNDRMVSENDFCSRAERRNPGV